MSSELVHRVDLREVAYEPEVERLSLVFVELDGQVHRMELPFWAAHQLSRALKRFGVGVLSPVEVRSARQPVSR